MYSVLTLAVIMTIAITAVLVLVTNKAYSRKWENEDDEKQGQV